MPVATKPMDASVYMMIHTSCLQTPEHYQRRLDKGRSKRIAAAYSPDAVGVLLVGKHKGVYYVYDGQHRLQAIHEAFPEGCYVPCQLTKLPAHIAIILKNTNVKAFSGNDRFWCNLEGKEKAENTVFRVMETEFGITLSRGQNKGRYAANECKCVDTLLQILDGIGEENFRFMADMLVKYFSRPDGNGVEAAALISRFLVGFAAYLGKGNKFFIEGKLMRNKLSAADIDKLAKKNSRVSDGNRWQAVLAIFQKMK